MKFLFFLLLMCSLAGYAQDDRTIEILQKRYAGKELTESERALLKQWEDDLQQLIQERNLTLDTVRKPITTAPFKMPPMLTDGSYLELCKSLLKTYGDKVGASLPLLEHVLASTKNETDGADMGAAMLMQGAASSSVYCIASSALKKPKDVLTANNLGAALLQAGDHTKALQVLLYADKLKPNIGLIITNLGWVYRELGSVNDAKIAFKKALSVAKEMTSPYLGLGLIAEEEENYSQARAYLRKALEDQYSEVGMAVYKESKPKNPSSSEGPLSDEKGSPHGLTIPELPSSESIEEMATNVESLKSHNASLEQNVTALAERYKRQLRQINKREEELSRRRGDFVLIPRDFSREKMILDDIAEQVFGANSRFMQAKRQSDIHNEQLKNEVEQVTEELGKAIKDAMSGGGGSGQKVCLLMKKSLELSYEMAGKYYPQMAMGNQEDIIDYYAYTDLILERIYQPEYNELYNTQRELIALSHHQIITHYGAGLAQIASEISKLDCNQAPKSPSSQDGAIEEAELPNKGSKNCPLGPEGIKAGMGALAIELSCTHVKLSGGEGVLWSVDRDFVKHETKIWGGVGAKAEYGKGMLSGEASMGVELTLGNDNAVKDVAFTSSVKAGVGGLLESEISGRFSIEGGPSIDSNAGYSQLGLPYLE